MQLTTGLGYFTLDNPTSNDSALEHVAHWSRAIWVPFEPKPHRIGCLVHVINRIVKSLICGDHSVTIDIDLLEEYNDVGETDKTGQWRRYWPLWKLDNCIHCIMRKPQRRKHIEDKYRNYITDCEPATLIHGNDNWGIGEIAASSWAINHREPLEDFIAASIRADNESTLTHHQWSPGEWQMLRTLLEIVQPFTKWTLMLQQRNTPATLANVRIWWANYSSGGPASSSVQSWPSHRTSCGGNYKCMDQATQVTASERHCDSSVRYQCTGTTLYWMVHLHTMLQVLCTRIWNSNSSKTNGQTLLNGSTMPLIILGSCGYRIRSAQLIAVRLESHPVLEIVIIHLILVRVQCEIGKSEPG